MTITDQTTTSPELPRWDLTSVAKSVDDPAFVRQLDDLYADVAALQERFDQLGIGTRGRSSLTEDVAAFDEIIPRYNDVLDRYETYSAFLYGSVSADTQDASAQARLSTLEEKTVDLLRLGPRLTAWIGSLDIEELQQHSEVAREHAYFLHVEQEEAAHLLSPGEEDLLAGLRPSGPGGWEKLHQDLTSQIMVPFAAQEGGEPSALPMSEIRNLAFDPDRSVRERAYRAELNAWEENALPLAAAMNGIKGHVAVVSRRRKYDSPLDQALKVNHLDRQTLEAMLGAAEDAFPVFRRYLNAKAQFLGLERLAWFDLFAPVPGDGASDPERWSWPNAVQFVVSNFGMFSENLRGLAERAFTNRWVDAGSRTGKVGGAYCMWLRRGESRILANFLPAYSGASTLAHELGHAYHNFNQAALPPLRRSTPMTLAETASTFCETIVRNAALQDAAPHEQLVILEAFLQDAAQIVLDISSRFRFEARVLEARHERQLSVAELNNLMIQTQRETYGDGLAGESLHPYMWAVKSHYYSELSFYNFPYLFGLLFGMGLYTIYEEQPSGFHDRYDSLLASTGQADPYTLAKDFGIDLHDRSFWERSLQRLGADVDRFIAAASQTKD